MWWRASTIGVALIVSILAAGCGVSTAGQTGTSGPTGTVQGIFEIAGGPAIPKTNGLITTPTSPISGIVSFTDASGHTTDVTTGSDGTFSVRLPAGKYTVTGLTPTIQMLGGTSSPVAYEPCGPPVTAVVRASQTSKISVICPVP
jgi:hypothetical protein